MEADLREAPAESARLEVRLVRRSSRTTPSAAIDRLIDMAYGSPERLWDAAGLLGEGEQEPLALLTRAQLLVHYPVAPALPKPFSPPDAPRP